VAALACAVVACVAACSSGTPARAARLSDEDASRLSQVLAKNYDAGGATFVASLPVEPGVTLSLAGEVDFAGHRGRADVTWSGNPAPGRVVEVAWSEDALAERLPGLADALTGAGKPPAAWVGRTADPAAGVLDRVVQFVARLSSTQRDNPVLVQQDERAGWLRSVTIEGTAMDVYRYGDGLTFWVGVDDGRLHQVQGGLAGFAGPLAVAFPTVGPQAIPGPRRAEVVAVDDVRALYDRLNPAPR
jgi:hypothetical protein